MLRALWLHSKAVIRWKPEYEYPVLHAFGIYAANTLTNFAVL